VDDFNVRKAIALLGDDPYAVFAKAVLSGRAAGRVYLDDPDAPSALAAVSDEEARCYLSLGTPPADPGAWRAAIERTILADQAELGDEAMECFLPPDAGDEVRGLLEGMDAAWNPALLYVWRAGTPPAVAPAPEGYALAAITDDALDSGEWSNVELITDEWEDRIDSVDGVRGFCLVSDGEVAAACHIDFRHEAEAEIGVITDARHRRRGLASCAAANAIAFFSSRGIDRVVWHAPVDNLGSRATAERCGMAVEREFGEYLLHSRRANRLLMRGFSRVRSGALALAAADYREALRADAAEPVPFAGWHGRDEVLEWILECYCDLRDAASIDATLASLGDYGLAPDRELIERFAAMEPLSFLAESAGWRELIRLHGSASRPRA
jgi:RimJ/RimL family protein N-acetyltransferase